MLSCWALITCQINIELIYKILYSFASFYIVVNNIEFWTIHWVIQTEHLLFDPHLHVRI